MQLTPPEYKLIKCLQDLNKIFITTGTIPVEELKKFCSIFLGNSIAGSRFVAMFESCYNKVNKDQLQFYQLSRRMDNLMIEQMTAGSIFKKYDIRMGNIMDLLSGAPYTRYQRMHNEYLDNESFQFESIVIPKKVKATKKVFKFDPANLM